MKKYTKEDKNMGLIDKLRGFINGSNNTPVVQEEDKYEKLRLATEIVNLAGKINRINCFDGSIRELTNLSEYDLQKRSMTELKQLHDNLNNKYSSLVYKRDQNNAKNDADTAAKWTGQRAPNTTAHDLDFSQRGD